MLCEIGSFLINTSEDLSILCCLSQQQPQLAGGLGLNSGKEQIRLRNDLFSLRNFLFFSTNDFTIGKLIIAL